MACNPLAGALSKDSVSNDVPAVFLKRATGL